MRSTLLLIFALLLSFPVSARTLYWQSLDVDARLDEEGRLHVKERQTIVFDGDWNGGERTFRLEPGQKLDLHSITRTDPVTGTQYRLRKGDLDEVDEYDWADSVTLRWRSRMPSDPPFEERVLIYELDYTMSRVVVHVADDQYVLDHDFAFADRSGAIERFRLDLELDPAWRATARFERTVERSQLLPGLGVLVTIPMEYVPEGSPAGVEMAAPRPVRFGFGIVLLAAAGVCLQSLIVRERARGRFLPLTRTEQIDEEWLESNLFSAPPEVVGAAWDSRVAAAEVAAMLARMVSEGKLASRTEEGSRGFFGRKPVLHLELLVSRDELSRTERDLVNGLFPGKRTVTDTELIREHYEKRGFNPASKISKGVEKAARSMYSGTRKLDFPAFLSTRAILLLLALVLAMGAATALTSPGSMLVLVGAGAGLAIGFVASAIVAGITKNRVENVGVWIGLTSLLLVGLIFGAIAITVTLPLSLTATAAVDLIGLLLLMVGVRSAATSNSRSQIELRKKLVAARHFFIRELRQKQPRLKDEWFPWLIAFGLGGQVDHWFRSFGGDTSRHIPLGSSRSSSSGGQNVSGWSGGGGAFGGAGATASWVAAASSISSGVPAPSSSGSGGGSSGGGGGGSSSGGGGGGGW